MLVNQLVGVCVSHPLYFLLSLSFCYGFFKQYVCLSVFSAGSLSGVGAGEHQPH